MGPTLIADRFEVDRLAGSGGVGTVYRARDRASGEVVAVKLLHARELDLLARRRGGRRLRHRLRHRPRGAR